MRTALKASVIALSLCVPLAAHAHRVWLLPSATVLSGDDVWVTVDAAVSNDLFYFEHFPLRIANIGTPPADMPGGRGAGAANLQIKAPDGSKVDASNGSIGRYRSTFDVKLAQKGTYKIAVSNEGIFASYKLGGETKRWRGNAEALAKEIPADAQDLKATMSQSRVEVFVTSGKPTRDALKITGAGLELDPVTHPNDLTAGTAATFRLLIDGKPAAGLKVNIVPGGNRYRDKLNEMHLTTDSEGKFSVTWPEPGMYWMEAVVRENASPVKGVNERRASYVATLEVLPQ
jgi:uncharacterized GH25 family protein